MAAFSGDAPLARHRQRGFKAMRQGQNGAVRDAFSAAISEGLPLYAADEPGTQDKALLGRALANSFRGRGIS